MTVSATSDVYFDPYDVGLIAARGAILDMVKANIEIPPGTVIFEDPPIQDIRRKLLSRMFTPRKVNALEPKIRGFCQRNQVRN